MDWPNKNLKQNNRRKDSGTSKKKTTNISKRKVFRVSSCTMDLAMFLFGFCFLSSQLASTHSHLSHVMQASRYTRHWSKGQHACEPQLPKQLMSPPPCPLKSILFLCDRAPNSSTRRCQLRMQAIRSSDCVKVGSLRGSSKLIDGP